MDSSLLKEREAFKRRALAQPAVENKIRRTDAGSSRAPASSSSSNKVKAPDMNYKSLAMSSSASQLKFGVLARIVRHMKMRHQEGDIHPLTLHDILDETGQLNVPAKIQQWLLTDALPNNPKLVKDEQGWVFNPVLSCRDRKSLLRLLKHNDLKGRGGVLLEDIQESVPNHAKVMKMLAEDVLKVDRQDKKQIVFYHDRSKQFKVDNEFILLWRNTSVDGMNDDNIDEYLTNQGIKSMQDLHKNVFRPARRKTKRRHMPTKITDNDHLAHILHEYDQP